MILVTPGAGWWDGTPTVFTADAAGTTDLEDPPAALTYSWDWGDGSPLDSGELATHTYDAAGVYDLQLTVTDTGGMSASATFLVVVNSQAETLDVTTQADENHGGATPASPGGSGFSLR